MLAQAFKVIGLSALFPGADDKPEGPKDWNQAMKGGADRTFEDFLRVDKKPLVVLFGLVTSSFLWLWVVYAVGHGETAGKATGSSNPVPYQPPPQSAPPLVAPAISTTYGVISPTLVNAPFNNSFGVPASPNLGYPTQMQGQPASQFSYSYANQRTAAPLLSRYLQQGQPAGYAPLSNGRARLVVNR